MLNGVEKVLRALESVKEEARAGFERAVRFTGDDLLDAAKDHTDYPFQTVPSYVLDSRRALERDPPVPGYKRYPAGTIGTFARRAPSLEGTPWAARTQLRISPDVYGQRHDAHPLHRELVHSIPRDHRIDGKVWMSEVGYPAEVAEGGERGRFKEISWVIEGTPKMQPRNFLAEILFNKLFISFYRDRLLAAGEGLIRQRALLT